MKKTILLDVDDVLLSYSDAFLKHYGIPYSPDKSYQGFEGILNMERSQVNEMVNDFNNSPYFSSLEPICNAKEALHFFLNNNFSIKLVTSCGTSPETKFYRKVNLIDAFGKDVIDEVSYLNHGESKKEYLSQHDPEHVMIWVEDSPNNYFDGVSLGIDSFLMSTPFNKHYHDKSMVVHDWNEIKNKIASKMKEL